MRLIFSFLIFVLGTQVVSAQVLFKEVVAESGQFIVDFVEPELDNYTALSKKSTRHKYMSTLKERIAFHVANLKQSLADTDVVVKKQLWMRQSAVISLSPEFLPGLKSLTYVKNVSPDRKYQIQPQLSPIANDTFYVGDDIARIDLDGLWSEGYRGQGVVVAILDSGVDGRHKELAGNWRGGVNSWYVPNTTPSATPTIPTDFTGHGTGVASLIVGGNTLGEYLGVAPEATWIAARVIDSTIRESDVHDIFSWIANPDDDDTTDDYPDIVQNSWAFSNSSGIKCQDSYPFSADFSMLNQLGIDIVFSVGNGNASSSTGISTYVIPANDPYVISVGAVDDSNEVFNDSARGPDRCGSLQVPSLVAPGTSVRVADISNSIDSSAQGTSYAAPMVAGALALLRSKYKVSNVSGYVKYRQALFESTGQSLADDAYGWGLVQASAAAEALKNYAGVSVVDKEINFSFAKLVGEETGGSVSVTLLRSGDLNGSVSVRLNTIDGTATEGQDYDPLNDLDVEFLTGEAQKVVDITLYDDTDGEGVESFTVQLTPLLGVLSTRNTSTTINIIDDEQGDAPVDEIGGASLGLLELFFLLTFTAGRLATRWV